MIKLFNLLQEIQNGRVGKFEYGLYKVEIKEDRITEEEIDIIFDNVEWFEMIKPGVIFFMISQKEIDNILKLLIKE